MATAEQTQTVARVDPSECGHQLVMEQDLTPLKVSFIETVDGLARHGASADGGTVSWHQAVLCPRCGACYTIHAGLSVERAVPPTL